MHLKDDVVSLATPHGRMIGTPGHREARKYLVERLRAVGAAPYGKSYELPYRQLGYELCNVMGFVPGEQADLPPVVLGAHYDTCGPLPGADDNAAAVAISLAVAERLLARPTQRSVIVALFDGEEPPCSFTPAMGSIHWYHHQRKTPVHCAVVMDLVGHDVPHPGLEDLLFVTGMESDPDLVMDDLSADGLRVHPVLNRYIGDLSDHHVFRNDHRPYLFLSCGRWAHYHAATDTPDRLNYDKMAAIAVLVEQLVRRVDSRGLAGPFDQGDTLALEIEAIRRHFGGVIDTDILRFGRKGVDGFVRAAMATLGL